MRDRAAETSAHWRTFLGLLAIIMSFSLSTYARAAEPVATLPPEKIAELSKLLNDPAVGAWIKAQAAADAKPVAAPTAAIQGLEQQIRANFHEIIVTLPAIPADFVAAAARVRVDARNHGFAPALVLLAGALLACFGGEWLVRRSIRRARRNDPMITRAAVELLPLVAFAAIAGMFFFLFSWPPMLRAFLLFALLAVIAFRFVVGVAVIALASGSMSSFMFKRVLLFAAILLLALAYNALITPLGMNPNAGRTVIFVASILLLLMSVETVWRRPVAAEQTIRTKVAYSLYLAVLWILSTLGFHVFFLIGVYAVVLPEILPAVDRMAKAFAATHWQEDVKTSIRATLLVQGAKTLIIVAAVLSLTIAWQSNPRALGHGSPIFASVIMGLFKGMLVLVVADLCWIIARTLINRKIADVSVDTPSPPEEMARRARLRTLLPIFRNALAAVLLVVSLLMVLAELGVEIGPLIAGAGIFGVALGFGAQTLVKDVISGVFYLMDDAFRVGEYIQSGGYKGTVESFSLRSVRLRHHRGPVFTVPFGELGAVQNMSRDWAIDKFTLRVGFDTDMAKAKKLTKVVGAEIKADPELGPLLIDTLKMKGVEQIGDYGIELSFAFTAVPGNQSMIRRRAYILIRKTFIENGIEFAQPTVQVGGDDKSDAAVAAHTFAENSRQAALASAAAAKG